jgi:hypothetical protein
MGLSGTFDLCIYIIALMSISFLIAPSAISSIAPMSNSTTPFASSGATEFISGIGPYVGLFISGLLFLYRRLKDRNWKKKYENVIVTRPFP